MPEDTENDQQPDKPVPVNVVSNLRTQPPPEFTLG
jgi:hypothetical protein